MRAPDEPPPPDEPLDTDVPDEPPDPVAHDTTTQRDRPRDHVVRPPRDHDAPPSIDPDAVAAEATTMVLGAISSDIGTYVNRLRDGAPTTDAASVLAQASTIGDATTAGRIDVRHSRADGPSGEFGFRRADGQTGPVDEGEVLRERILTVRIDDDDPAPSGPGRFDIEQITRAVRARRAAIRACYEHALTAENPALAGRVAVEMTVAPAGNVRAETIDNDTGSSGLGACVARTLGAIRFPTGPEGGEVTVSYPFVFAPQS
jgi:hypothetical protein